MKEKNESGIVEAKLTLGERLPTFLLYNPYFLIRMDIVYSGNGH